MIRVFCFVISFAMITFTIGAANAATVKWCFNFETRYDYDWAIGADYEDYLLPEADNFTTVDASYLSTVAYRCADYYCYVAMPPYIWSQNLDINGCTTEITMPTGTFKFKYFVSSKAETPDDRRLFALPDGTLWGDEDGVDVVQVVVQKTVLSGNNVFTVRANFRDEVEHLLGVGCTAMRRRAYNAWDEDTDVWMSADDNLTPASNFCTNTFSRERPEHEDEYEICISPSNLHKKFIIGHQFGDVFALMNEGLHNGDPDGSEGCFRATGIGGRCDCDEIDSRSFCIGSREFTGKAQREGYASFEAAVILNNRSSAGGAFVNDYRVMKWSSTHGGTLPTIYDPIWPPPDPYYLPPFPVDLDHDENVKWMEYECNPSGTFTHFATEWDWMDFFWNLWTEGGTSNQYDVDAINLIWHGFYATGDPISEMSTEYASLCCMTSDEDPTSCVKRDLDEEDGCGEGTYEDYLTEFKVGRLWSTDMGHGVNEGVLQDADGLYGSINPTKYTHFLNTGDNTGVNH